MKEVFQKKENNFISLFIGVIFIVGIFILNNWIQGEFENNKESQSRNSSIKKIKSDQLKKHLIQYKGRIVIRKTYLDPGRKFSESIFYVEDKEVARHKTAFNGEIYDRTGIVLEGKVEFFNPDGTYGEEYYRDNQLNGKAKTYYKNGVLKSDIDYQYGKMLIRKEYYNNEHLRMEVDYQDAREDQKSLETGIGKLYFQNGKVKFEWHLTNTHEVGFKKSYNRYGTLMGEIYYDEEGNVTHQKGY